MIIFWLCKFSIIFNTFESFNFFSIDEEENTIIWDLLREKKVAHINSQKKFRYLKQIKYLENLKILVLCTQNEVHFLEMKSEHFDINSIQLKNKNSCLFSFLKNKNSLFSLQSNTKQINKYYLNNKLSLPENIKTEKFSGAKFIGTSDILLTQTYFVQSTETNMKNKSWFRILLLDLQKALHFDKSQENEVLYASLPKSNTESQIDLPGQYEIFKSEKAISSYFLVSIRGLQSPNVYIGDEICKQPELYKEIKKKEARFGYLYIGTVQGFCFKLDLFLDSEDHFSAKKTVLFKDGFPVQSGGLNYLKKDQNLLNSEYTSKASNSINSQPSPMDLKTMICQRFVKDKIEVVVIAEKKKTGPYTFNFEYTLFVRNFSSDDWSSLHLSGMNSYTITIKTMENKSNSNLIKFYGSTENKMKVFTFEKSTLKIRESKSLEVSFRLQTYNFEQKMFYIPKENTVEIFNDDLSQLVSVLKYDSTVAKVEIFGHRFVVYDEEYYHELDLDTLTEIYKASILESENSKNKNINMNLDILPENKQVIILNRSKEGFEMPRLYNPSNFFQIWDFTFNEFVECFSKINYKKNIKLFARFYFTKIAETNYIDDIFGPLNPLIFSIYYNDTKLLLELLKEYRYPRRIRGYLSPLSFAFKMGFISIVKFLSGFLSHREYKVDFTRKDFEYLLDSRGAYCHKLLGTIPREAESNHFPNFLKMKETVRLYESNTIQECLQKIKQKKKPKIIYPKKFKLDDNKNPKNKRVSNQSNKSDVTTYEIPFKYSYSSRSPGSIQFLDSFSNSNNEDFLLSQWKSLVIIKWKRQRFLQILLAFIYWLFSGFAVASIVFATNIPELSYVCLGFLAWLIIFELVQIISYSVYNIKKYFSNNIF